MCGRYTLVANRKAIEALIEAPLETKPRPDYNISPGREVLAVRARQTAARQIGPAAWGLHRPKNFLINARLETADQLPTFREAWRIRRAVVPASGFYEWQRDAAHKTPFYFSSADRAVFLFAALWFQPAAPAGPPALVLLTTAANKDMEPVHDRMPVILQSSQQSPWLDGELGKDVLLASAGAQRLNRHPVSDRVNSARNNDYTLVEAVTPPRDDQMDLFA